MNETRRAWLGDVRLGTVVYLVTSLPVFLGVLIGTSSGLIDRKGPVEGFLHGCCHFDGGHYESVIHDGYRYENDRGSNIAFFPGYPLAVHGVQQLTGSPTRLAMVVASNLALLAAFILLAAYLRVRSPGNSQPRLMTLLLIGLWPVGFFFRMGYSESLFLLVLALLLLGLAKRWPVWLLAMTAGALTGIRPVGVAASAAVTLRVLVDPERGSPGRRILTAVLLAPLSCWGLLAFMGFQQARFGTPLAFVATQEHWAFYTPDPGDIPTKAARLALLEPIWNAYIPGSSRFWARYEEYGMPLLGLAFWNPVLFLLFALAVIHGWRRGELTRDETVLSLGLLLIPYFTRADEISMGSHARFAAVAIPAYIVLGRLIRRLSPAVRWSVFAILLTFLTLWSALFAARWPLC